MAVGPRLKDGSYALVTGTDNDYSVTQNATGQQFDVYFRVSDPDPFVGSIQCPLGLTTGCFTTADIADGINNEMFDLPNDGRYKLLPGVLHAYKVSAADLGNFVRHDHHHDGDDDDDQGDDDKEEAEAGNPLDAQEVGASGPDRGRLKSIPVDKSFYDRKLTERLKDMVLGL